MHSLARFWILGLILLPMVVLFVRCDSSADEAATAFEPSPARVKVMTVQPQAVMVYDELPGRVSAFRTAEIRPQVNGIIQNKLFEEGSFVEAGSPLFQIDPAPFAADVDAARAVLARTEAELVNAQVKFDRAKLLSSQKITSAEAFNDATSALAQAKAGVAEAEANLARRRLELSNATIRSPISGIIGQSFMTEGGLASASATAPLAVVQQIDQVYIDVRKSSVSLENLDEKPAGARDLNDAPVIIKTITGKPYGHTGRMLFSDVTVDSATGSVGIRILVPNPEGYLLPGMFVRAMAPRKVYAAALLAPQEAVTRDLAGRPELTVVGADKTGVKRPVELGPLVDGKYIVAKGLAAGETIVVQGQERVQNGQPLEWSPSQVAAKTGS